MFSLCYTGVCIGCLWVLCRHEKDIVMHAYCLLRAQCFQLKTCIWVGFFYSSSFCRIMFVCICICTRLKRLSFAIEKSENWRMLSWSCALLALSKVCSMRHQLHQKRIILNIIAFTLRAEQTQMVNYSKSKWSTK